MLTITPNYIYMVNNNCLQSDLVTSIWRTSLLTMAFMQHMSNQRLVQCGINGEISKIRSSNVKANIIKSCHRNQRWKGSPSGSTRRNEVGAFERVKYNMQSIFTKRHDDICANASVIKGITVWPLAVNTWWKTNKYKHISAGWTLQLSTRLERYGFGSWITTSAKHNRTTLCHVINPNRNTWTLNGIHQPAP